MDTSAHTHKSLCQHWTFFPLHVDTSWLHGPKVTSAASRRHAAKADNVRLLLQRDLNRIHQLFRRRSEVCQAKSWMHFHFQNGYSRSWKFDAMILQYITYVFASGYWPWDNGQSRSSPAGLLELAAGSARPKSILSDNSIYSLSRWNDGKFIRSAPHYPIPILVCFHCIFCILLHMHTHIWLSG